MLKKKWRTDGATFTLKTWAWDNMGRHMQGA